MAKHQCPAKVATCCKCHRCGHFQSVCRTKSLKAVTTTDEDIEDDLFVGMVEEPEPLAIPNISSGIDLWMVNIFLNDYSIEFQIDTGADVTVTSEDQYQKLKTPGLQPSSKSLVGPSQDKLQVCGKFIGTLTYKSNIVKQEVYVVKGLRKSLIGRPTIMAFKLISQVNNVKSS